MIRAAVGACALAWAPIASAQDPSDARAQVRIADVAGDRTVDEAVAIAPRIEQLLARCDRVAGVGGRVVVRLSIDPRGRVSEAAIQTDLGGSAAFHRCVTSTLSRVRFESGAAGTVALDLEWSTPPEDGVVEGDSVGSGFALGMRGTGPGGGGRGSDVLGPTGTIGGPSSTGARGDGASSAAVGPRPVGVTGSISREAIHRVVTRHIREVQACYERELAGRPQLSGTLYVRMVIAGDGSVTSATIERDTLGSPAVAECVTAVVARWTFRRSAGAGVAEVLYPFSFRDP